MIVSAPEFRSRTFLAVALAMAAMWLLAASPVAADTVLPLSDTASLGTFYLDVNIGGGVDEYLVDTGAGYMTITAATRDRLQQEGLARPVGEIEGHLANGQVLRVPLYRLEKITIGGTCELRDVDVAVLPGASRGLFGLSALRQISPFRFSMDPPSLTLSNCTQPLLTASNHGGDSQP